MKVRIGLLLMFVIFVSGIFSLAPQAPSSGFDNTLSLVEGQSGFLDENAPIRVAYRDALTTNLVNVGRAPFGIAHKRFRCTNFLASLNKLNFLHIAWLFNTFGQDNRCLIKLLNDPRLITLETNLINEPGHRNNRLEKHEFLYGVSSPKKFDRLLKSRNARLRRKFSVYVAPLQNLLVGNLQPHTECLINPGLESNVSASAGKVLVQWAREEFPFCRIVWNPLQGAAVGTTAELLELHGPAPKFPKGSACLTNLDGTDINFPQRKSLAFLVHEKDPLSPKNYINAGNALQQYIAEYANRCEFVMLWVAEDNCFSHNTDLNMPWISPTKRSCSVGITNKLTAKEVRSAHEEGVGVPKVIEYSEENLKSFVGCTEIRSPVDGPKKNFLLKQSEFSDRGGTILLPASIKNPGRVVVVFNGKTIDIYEKAGVYNHDSNNARRPLYRSTKSPVKYPLRVAIKITTSGGTICYKIPNPKIRND